MLRGQALFMLVCLPTAGLIIPLDWEGAMETRASLMLLLLLIPWATLIAEMVVAATIDLLLGAARPFDDLPALRLCEILFPHTGLGEIGTAEEADVRDD
jgi:hypothetical protein